MTKSVVYGPVPSRRLGRSLGVDLVPYKICSYDCIYCQIGRTPATAMERRPYVTTDKVLADVTARLNQGVAADYITLGGSGEPTLNSNIGEIIRRLRSDTDIAVTVLTNGSTLMLREVREELLAADVVLPSFDAPDAEIFRQINRPCPEITFEQMADGMLQFREAYAGEIWVEIFLVAGLNTGDEAVRGFKSWMDRIRPDRIHLNTAVRPTAESDVQRPSDALLMHIRDMLGDRAEIVVPYQGDAAGTGGETLREDLLNLLARRPCTLSDIASGLNTHPHEILKYLQPLVDEGEVDVRRMEAGTYYQRTGDM
mgnify:CR=1 FL=1